MASNIKVGIAGFGKIAQTVHLPLMESVGGFDIVAVASSDPDKVHDKLPAAQVVPDIGQLVDQDIDLVLITTPNYLHAPLAITALTAGKHVIVEKPFTLSLKEAEDVVAAATAAGKFVTVFQNKQFDSDYIGLQRLLADGTIGELKSLESNYNRYRPIIRDRWREDGSAGSGLWYDLGPHLVDQVLRICGLPEWVYADLFASRTGGVSDDWFLVELGYATHRVILRADSFEAGGGTRFVVRGTNGTAYKQLADTQEQQLAAGVRPGDPTWGEDLDPWVVFSGEDAQRTEYASGVGCEQQFYQAVAEHIHAGSPLPITTESALATMAVIEAGIESNNSGTRVPIAR